MLNYSEQYDAKKCSPEQAVALIKTDDTVLAAGRPSALLEALGQAKARFSGLRLCSVYGLTDHGSSGLCSPDAASHVAVSSGILSKKEEAAWLGGNIDQVVVHLSAMDQYILNAFMPKVLLIRCPPPDEEGFFSVGIADGGASIAAERGAKVIVQIDENLPMIPSDSRIHINRVDAVCECSELLPKENAGDSRSDGAATAIAGYVAEMTPDGSAIQLGAGSLPDLVGRCLSSHKDLGIHTDYFSGAHVELIKKGVVNNSKKEVMRGVSVGAYFGVTAENRDFLHHNLEIMMKKADWIYSPEVISQIGRVMAVNEASAVDFRAQVCAGSLGSGVTGGVGGILDFTRGAKRSIGGKSFIVMRSTSMNKDGVMTSNICPALPAGSLVSVPRSDVMYIATEYGVADFRDLSVKERVKALVSLAHPDYRDWLADEAAKHGYS